MKWHFINFDMVLPLRFKEACEEVFIKNDKSKHAAHEIKIKFCNAVSPKQQKEFQVRTIKSGTLLFNNDKTEFHYYPAVGMHPPALLSQLLLQIIKITGLQFEMFLMHSACVIKNNGALLIPGAEGRGKTTFTKSVKTGSILNDDLSLIALDHARDRFVVCRVPSPEDLKGEGPFLWKGPYEIEKVVFIRREMPEGLELLTETEAGAYYSEEGPQFISNESMPEYDRIIKKLFNKVKACRISYDPKAGQDFI